ncbi:MAG: disulfide bond formation protein B [Pseudomonadota bacterium]
MITKKFTYQNLLFFLLLTSIFALLGAYISQYIFGMQPCQLCFWQRKPFFAIIILAVLFLMISSLKNYQKLAIWLAILLLLINAAIAFYHSGVEQKWFAGLDSCSMPEMQINNVEDLKLALEQTKAVRCDQPQFMFLKLSMASWNFIYCLLAASFSYCALRIIKNKND